MVGCRQAELWANCSSMPNKSPTTSARTALERPQLSPGALPQRLAANRGASPPTGAPQRGDESDGEPAPEGVGDLEDGIRPPKLTAETIVGGIYEIVYSRVLHGRTAELPQLLPDLAYSMMQPYVGHAKAERMVAPLRTPSADGRAGTGKLAVTSGE